jgi:hypothetical protein
MNNCYFGSNSNLYKIIKNKEDKMDIQKAIISFKKNGYQVKFFQTPEEAASYLNVEIHQTTVGLGDSQTLLSMKLYEKLSLHNQVFDPQHCPHDKSFVDVGKRCLQTDVFITSVNGASETGVLINIDARGNRVAGSLFGHKKVFFVFGINKIVPSLEEAIWRARNIAAPQNAKRHGYKTPCALKADKCYDCSSPERICNLLAVHYKKMKGTEVELIIINKSLGY